MVQSVSDRIEFLKKLLQDREEQILRQKELTDKIKQLKDKQKDKPEVKKEISDIKHDLKTTRNLLKNTKSQVRWLAIHICETRQIRLAQALVFLTIALCVGFILGNFAGPIFSSINLFSKMSAESLIICEEIYNHQPAGLGPTFEIGQSKFLYGYSEISSRADRIDYYIEWLHRGVVQETTPMPVTNIGGPAWSKKEFDVHDLGDWEARLKTRDGNTWGVTTFKIVYPKIELLNSAVCNDVINDEPLSLGKLFLAKDKTLYCFTETEAKEKYIHIYHEWFFKGNLIQKSKIQLDQLKAKSWSQHNITATETGQWYINVVAGDGTIINRLDFEVQPQKIAVQFAELYDKLKDGKPDTALARYVANGEKIYFFSTVMGNFPNYKIQHQWNFDNRKIFSETFVVDSLGANLFSAAKINASQSGLWKINVLDGNGKILATKEVNFEKPITDLVKINSLVFCRTVFQMDPYDIASKFKISGNTKIWAHAAVNSKKSLTEITYKWYYDGKLIKSNTIKNVAKSTGYRTYDYKTVMPQQKGTWIVQICAEDGTLLRKKTFIVE